MEYRADSSAQLRVAFGGSYRVRGNLFSPSICGTQRGGGNCVFRSHAQPGARVHHAVHISLHVCC
jgi:hypothetical protein